MLNQLEVKPSYSCNNNCLFCLYKGTKSNVEYEELKRKIYLFKINYDIDIIEISGGEPTIYCNFFKMIKYIKSVGIKYIVIHTNARRFSNIEFINKMPKYNYYFFISIQSIDSSIHNLMVGKSSAFQETKKGIENLSSHFFNISIVTNTVLTKYNFERLPELAKFLCKIEKVTKIEIRLPVVLPERDCYYVIKDLKKLKYIIEETNEITSHYNKELQLFNIPYCLFSDFYEEKTKQKNIKKKFFFIDGHNLHIDIDQFKAQKLPLATVYKNYNELYYKKKNCSQCNYDSCLGISNLYTSEFKLKIIPGQQT